MEQNDIYNEKEQLMERVKGYVLKKLAEQKTSYLICCGCFALIFILNLLTNYRQHDWCQENICHTLMYFVLSLFGIMAYYSSRYWQNRIENCQDPNQLLENLDRMNRSMRWIVLVYLIIIFSLAFFSAPWSVQEILITCLIIVAISYPFFIYYWYKTRKIGVKRLREILSQELQADEA